MNEENKMNNTYNNFVNFVNNDTNNKFNYKTANDIADAYGYEDYEMYVCDFTNGNMDDYNTLMNLWNGNW